MNFYKKDDDLWRKGRNYAFIIISFAVITLGILAIHTLLWHGRNYRQDELMVAFEAMGFSIQTNVINLATTDVHVPLWWILSDIYVGLFGHLEPITRFQALLGTALALAFLFRLATDLFNRQVGLVAVFVLGTSFHFKFYSHEFRMYYLLCLETIAFNLFFLRWIRHRNFLYAFLTVACGVLLIYTHYYSLYVLAASFLFFILLVRWSPKLLLKGLAIFTLISLSFIGWILPFLHTLLVSWPGGIWYAVANTDYLLPISIVTELSPSPLIGRIALALSIYIFFKFVWSKKIRLRIPDSQFRWGSGWVWPYLWLTSFLLLVLPYLSNSKVQNVTIRNLIIVPPFLAILVASTIVFTPRRLKWALLPLIGFASVLSTAYWIQLQPFNEESGPYKEEIAAITPTWKPGARVVVDCGYIFKHMSYWYYLDYRFPESVPNDHGFYIMDFTEHPEQRNYLAIRQQVPDPPIWFSGTLTTQSLQDFQTFLKDAQQVWYIQDMPTRYSPQFLSVLQADFSGIQRYYTDDNHQVIEFNRK